MNNILFFRNMAKCSSIAYYDSTESICLTLHNNFSNKTWNDKLIRKSNESGLFNEWEILTEWRRHVDGYEDTMQFRNVFSIAVSQRVTPYKSEGS